MKKMMIATLALISASVMAAPKTETTSTAKDPINGQSAVVLNVRYCIGRQKRVLNCW